MYVADKTTVQRHSRLLSLFCLSAFSSLPRSRNADSHVVVKLPETGNSWGQRNMHLTGCSGTDGSNFADPALLPVL